MFRYESGCHRVQRVPPTETRGRTHTSIINVMLLTKPEAKVQEIDTRQVEFSYYKDSGAGGQHRNRTLSGVRVKYKNLIVECCEGRDQRKNKEKALERLKDRLMAEEMDRVNALIRKQIENQNGNLGKRGSFDRNYNFKRDEVRFGDDKMSLKVFLRGNLEEIYEE